jgi:hypothetical protein
MIRKTRLDSFCDGEMGTTFRYQEVLYFCLIGCRGWSSPVFPFIDQCAVFESDKSQCFHILLGRSAKTSLHFTFQ